MNNIYNDSVFFDQYAKMQRSVDGLSAAGEWHDMKRLFPDFRETEVLDLGCGYGWHCAYAAEQGANAILGIDLSGKMIDEAKKRNSDGKIVYRICGIDEYEYPESKWDIVICNLALHYIENLESVFFRVHQTLKPEGVFIFNIEHPIYTAGVGQDWIYDDNRKPIYWPIDNYFYSGERKTNFLGSEVIKQHHTLTQILMGLLENNFLIEAVIEATPPEEMMEIPGMSDEMRRPMMLLVRAKSKKNKKEG